MDSHDLILPAQIYALGDKYFIASLKKKAREKFQVCARTVFARKCFYDAVQIVVHLNAGYAVDCGTRWRSVFWRRSQPLGWRLTGSLMMR
jgi:hypothetical protein